MRLCYYEINMATPRKSGTKQAGDQPVKRLKSGVPVTVGKKTQFKKGKSGNPAGKPKGTKHLSTYIRQMLFDENFKALLPHPTEGFKEHKGAPIEAIVSTALIRAMVGEKESREWLAKYGYGTKIELTGPDDGPVRAVVEIVRSGQSTDSTD